MSSTVIQGCAFSTQSLLKWDQHAHFYGGGGKRSMEKVFDSVHFQHISPFVISFMANYPFGKWFVHFLRGRGSEIVYVLYTHLNVDSYGRPLYLTTSHHIVLLSRALYCIVIYRLYRYFGYTIYIVSFILVA